MGERVTTMALTFLVLDTETTGTDPAKDQVIELGFATTDLYETLYFCSYLVRATVPISAEASAVHHLTDEDLINAYDDLPLAISEMQSDGTGWFSSVAYAAHNAPFDRQFLPTLTDKPWLDTLRMARRYLPDAPGHSNQVLRYHLKLDVPRDIPVHRAEGDCITTAALLRYLLTGPARDDFERLGVAEFAKHVDSPLVLTMCNFGKHAGKPWAEVPRDYLAWILRQPDFDPDVRFTAETYLRCPSRYPQI